MRTAFFFGVGIIQFGLFNSANYFHAQKICNTLEGRRKHNRGTFNFGFGNIEYLTLAKVSRPHLFG